MLPPKEFLKEIRPFRFLKDSELDYLLKNLEVEAFEEGEVLFKKGQKTKSVYVVFSGIVGLYDNGELVDHATKGDIIGIGLESGEVRYTAKAEEDTICYLIDKSVFNRLLEMNEKFREFFKSFTERKFRRFTEIAREQVLEDRIFFMKTRALITKEPVVCSPYTSVREAAIKMELNGVGSIVVVTGDMKPVGILTDHDLKRFIIHGRSPEEKVTAYMSSPPICIEGERPLFEAYAELLRKGINHLVVTDRGRVAGVITSKDILAQFEPSTSLVALYRKIRKARSVVEMEDAFRNIMRAVASLVLKGFHFYDLSVMITGIFDYTVTTVIKMVEREFEKEYGRLPEYLWLHMGSSARKEQVIATDQDNAIVHEGDDGILLKFAEKVNGILDAIGIPLCEGNYMASNPKWNRSIDEWMDMFSSWFEELTPKHVRYLSIFLDIRPIHGKLKLYDELLQEIYERKTTQALRYLAHDASVFEPPTGVFGLRRHKEIDLKKFGIYPIANGVRVLALENEILHVTNTKERIEVLGESGVIQKDLEKELLESYEFLQDLRLKFQAKAVIENRTEKANVVRIDEMDKMEVYVLKECFKIISSFQKFLKGKYAIERGL